MAPNGDIYVFEDVCIMPGVMPVIGTTDAVARAQLDLLQSYVDDTGA